MSQVGAKGVWHEVYLSREAIEDKPMLASTYDMIADTLLGYAKARGFDSIQDIDYSVTPVRNFGSEEAPRMVETVPEFATCYRVAAIARTVRHDSGDEGAGDVGARDVDRADSVVDRETPEEHGRTWPPKTMETK